ncbi:MAG TPA: M13 family metallopeptidase [Myxococcota bacterium]|nr:M13 family metallopeptidase [Myxococcota bacterium]
MSVRHLVPLALVLASCPKQAPTSSASVDLSDTSPEAIGAAIEAALDRKTDPCDDFYQFACGSWLANTEIPADRSGWSRGFHTIDDHNEKILKEILESGGGSDPRLGAFYGSCMDTDAIEKAGVSPIKPYLDQIVGVKDNKSLMEAIATLPMGSPFFDGDVDADFKDPKLNILHVSQGGLGLPERGYYFPEDDEGKELLADYQKHIAKMLGFIGWSADLAPAIVALETKLAEKSLPPEELRDPETLYHRIERAGLQQLTPSLPWDAAFAALGHPEITQINVATPDFFPRMEEIAKAGDWQTIRGYLAWRLINAAAPYLNADVEAADFAFYGTRLSGQKVQRARWKRCVEYADGSLGDVLAQAYVDRAFPGDSKTKALSMIQDIEASFEAGLESLRWMDDATRAAAREKLHAITNKIGYPDKWETYDGLQVGDGFFANNVAVHAWQRDDMLGDVGKPVDKLKWYMTAPTVNAYYNPLNNEIVFPAGILQPPFFSSRYPTAMNYGGMGMVMGHEITHGFDDEGRKFAPDGSLREWWDEEAAKRFEKRTQCVADLYDTFEPLPGLHVKGDLTLGENIADLGGIKLAARAFATWQAEGHQDATYAGFTPNQLFFVGYAQSWCSLQREQLVKMRIETDPHSPPKFRVNGPLSQLPAFAEAFQCKEGTPMHPKETCEVW